MTHNIDWSFIRDREGVSRIGYVPHDGSRVIGHSGVTIGVGVDLGQMSKGEISSLPISAALKTKIVEYAGIRGEAAVKFLETHPLKLSNEEADNLSDVVATKLIDQFVAQFDGDSAAPFDSLPAQFQTVLASLTLNFGPHWKQKLPTMYHLAASGDIYFLAKWLREEKWKQPQLSERRSREASLLLSLLPEQP